VIAEWNRLRAANPSRNIPAPPQALVGGLTFAGVNGQHRRVFNPDYTNIQPRVGCAYSFLPKTVMRGGIGIFHRTATQNNLTTGFSISTPYLRSLTADQFPSARLTGAYSLKDPGPNGIVRPVGSTLGIQTNLGQGGSFDDPNRKIPRTFQWSYTIERELPWNMVLEASYVGSLTNKEWRGVQMNSMPQADWDVAQSNPDFYQQRVPNPFYSLFPESVGHGAQTEVSRETLLRRYPHFTGVTNNLMPWPLLVSRPPDAFRETHDGQSVGGRRFDVGYRIHVVQDDGARLL
jgi:hypothetical protein